MSGRGSRTALRSVENANAAETTESTTYLHEVAPLAGRGLRMLGTAGLVTVVIALFGLAAINALIVEQQTTVDSLSNDVAAAQVSNERLRLELAELEAPQRIVAEATDRLGMVVPEDIVYLTPPNSVLDPAVVDAALVSPPFAIESSTALAVEPDGADS